VAGQAILGPSATAPQAAALPVILAPVQFAPPYRAYRSLESVIEANKEGYYRALRQTQGTIRSEVPNWQPWLIFFLRSGDEQVRRLEIKVEREKIVLAALRAALGTSEVTTDPIRLHPLLTSACHVDICAVEPQTSCKPTVRNKGYWLYWLTVPGLFTAHCAFTFSPSLNSKVRGIDVPTFSCCFGSSSMT
jgi:hypothetical protein